MPLQTRVFLAVLTFLLGAFVVRPAAAQQLGGPLYFCTDSRGEERVSDRVLATLVWESLTPQRHVRLIVLLRGAENWVREDRQFGHNVAVSPGNCVNTMTGVVGNTEYSVRLDNAARLAIINRRDTLRTARDSTTIVMVDRADGVGGAPRITSVRVPRVERAATEAADGEPGLLRFLRTIPVVATFIR
jgi:hypothetical protein